MMGKSQKQYYFVKDVQPLVGNSKVRISQKILENMLRYPITIRA